MQLKKITAENQIPTEYLNTPIGDLLKYHNLAADFSEYDSAQLLIGMCMDNRKHLRIPPNFAYIIRTGGANLAHSEFHISYAIAIGEIKQIALLAHDKCGMVNLETKREKFITGLVEKAGWDQKSAAAHFTKSAPVCEINNELEFMVAESHRLAKKYPLITVVPLFYSLADQQISLILE